MFTGIVTDIGEITALTPTAQGQLHRLRIACRYDRSGVAGGRTWFDVDAAAETLGMTTAKHWSVGTKLNLERSLKIGDELGGHIVAGHAGGMASIATRGAVAGRARVELRTTRELARFIGEKGSVTLDGVSLTVN